MLFNEFNLGYYLSTHFSNTLEHEVQAEVYRRSLKQFILPRINTQKTDTVLR
jgi:hypothetical protein